MKQWTDTDGTRPPSPHWGSKVMVKLRNGMEPQEPWLVTSCNWLWPSDSDDKFDIVAIRKVM